MINVLRRFFRRTPRLATAEQLAAKARADAYRALVPVGIDQYGQRWHRIVNPLEMGQRRAQEIDDARNAFARRASSETLNKFIAGVRKANEAGDKGGVDFQLRILEADLNQSLPFTPALHVIAAYHLTDREKDAPGEAIFFVNQQEMEYKVRVLEENASLAAFFLRSMWTTLREWMKASGANSLGSSPPTETQMRAAKTNEQRLEGLSASARPTTPVAPKKSPASSAPQAAKASAVKTRSEPEASGNSGEPSKRGLARNKLKRKP